jgi:hypothetical protein
VFSGQKIVLGVVGPQRSPDRLFLATRTINKDSHNKDKQQQRQKQKQRGPTTMMVPAAAKTKRAETKTSRAALGMSITNFTFRNFCPGPPYLLHFFLKNISQRKL